MKSPFQKAKIFSIFFLLIYLVLPIGFPSLAENAFAQRKKPEARDVIKIVDGVPKRVELKNGGYKLIYKNKQGIVFKEEEFALGVLVRRKVILKVYPSGQEAIVSTTTAPFTFPQFNYEIIYYDSKGVPTKKYSCVYVRYRGGGKKSIHTSEIWNRAKQKWVPTTRTTMFQDKDKKLTSEFEIWNVRKQKWVPDPKYTKTPQAGPGYKSTTNVATGLQSTTFGTPQGEIIFNLSDDLLAGDTISGSIYVKPEGQTAKEKARNSDKLGDYVIEMENQKVNSSSLTFQAFKWIIPEDVFGISTLVLKDKKGKEVARTRILIVPVSMETGSEYKLQEIGQQGGSIEVMGKFDGDFSTTGLSIGGEDAPIIAESPRRMVAYNNSKNFGVTEIEVRENGTSVKGEFRNIGIELSSPKLDLLKGEQTTLTVKVLGLEGIKNPVPLVLENKSPSIIRMGGGEVQEITIMPNQVQDGVYTMRRPLTGIKRGSFTITGTVISDPVV